MSQEKLGQGSAAFDEGVIFNRRYRVLRRIRAGGMGAIYEVVHVETRRRRALKVMLPSLLIDAAQRARFQREATITAGIRCEYLVDVFDAGVDADTGRPFMVMELFEGADLADHLKERGGPLPPAEVLILLGQAAVALDNTHVAGIVHLDIKPRNLFVSQRDDGSPRLKVLDFGLAAWVSALAAEGTGSHRAGTPLYMAPEQLGTGEPIGPAADLYALAHVAYQMLVGTSYWDDDRARMTNVFALRTILEWGPAEPATLRAARLGVTLPPAFDAWFARAAAPRPADRFTHASTMIVALAEALGEALPELSGPLSAPAPASSPYSNPLRGPPSAAEIPPTTTPSVPSPPPEAARRPPARRWTRTLVVASSALLLGVTGALIARQLGDEPRAAAEPRHRPATAEVAAPRCVPGASVRTTGR
jgi:serine/threonine-protein kinase